MRLTQKQENFVINLFQGMTQREAWIQAGYSSKYALSIVDINACKLANSNKIQLRWEELRKAAEDASIATVVERKQILTEIARARLVDYVTCGPDRDLIAIGPESPNTAALQEITSRTEVDSDGAGAAVVTKIKLHNPVSAIDLLNKMDKLYEAEGSVIIDNRTLTINVRSEKGKDLTQRLIEGAE